MVMLYNEPKYITILRDCSPTQMVRSSLLLSIIISALFWFFYINPQMHDYNRYEEQSTTLAKQCSQVTKSLEQYKKNASKKEKFLALETVLIHSKQYSEIAKIIINAACTNNIALNDFELTEYLVHDHYLEYTCNIVGNGSFLEFETFITTIATFFTYSKINTLSLQRTEDNLLSIHCSLAFLVKK